MDEDLFNYAISHNCLPNKTGYSPIEILKGGVFPAECVDEFSDIQPKASEISARCVHEEAWEARNVEKLNRVESSIESPKFKTGDQVIWKAQINPTTIKTSKGTVIDSTLTAALVKFETGRRVAWCSTRHLSFDKSLLAENALTA